MLNYLTLKVYLKAREILCSEKGQAMTEYGILVALIAVAVITVLGVMSGRLQLAFQKIVDVLPSQ